MIDLLTERDFRTIAETHGDHCVSAYLPTHRLGVETQQDPTRLKNLLATAISELEALGMKARTAEELLQPATELLGDADFWQHGDLGLAVLLGPDGMHVHRLPEAVPELVVVSDRFHIKPLLGSVTNGESFWILALAQNQVRLLRGTRSDASEVGLGEIPESLAAALWYEDRERQLQYHTADRVGRGTMTATFHGHGAGKDTSDADLAQFLRAVDEGLDHVIDDSTAPIVLAGVDRVLTAFREVTRHRRVVDGEVTGNAEHMSPTELHEQAWPVVREQFESDRRAAEQAVLDAAKPVSRDVADTLLAAVEGRVESLFVPVGTQRWGTVRSDGTLGEEHSERQPGDRDLLDAAAVAALLAGGKVYDTGPEAVPGGGLVAAALRF